MARARLLKPGFFANEDLAELPPHARLLFAGLWTLADRAGWLEDRPIRIRAALFPYENVDVDGLLQQLAAAGFVERRETSAGRYLKVVKFLTHQSPHHREPPSEILGKFQSRGLTGAGLGRARGKPRSSRPVTGDPVTGDPVTGDLFDRFWAAYPRRVDRPKAEKEWVKLKPDEALLERILAALDSQRRTPKWLKDRGEFIPYPASWLKGRRWEDELTTSVAADHPRPWYVDCDREPRCSNRAEHELRCRGVATPGRSSNDDCGGFTKIAQ